MWSKADESKVGLTVHPNHINLHMGKQEVGFTDTGDLTQVFEKSATDPKPNLLKCKKHF